MIQRYKRISIVWGSSVQNDARTLKDHLNTLRLQKRFPIKATIVNDPFVAPKLDEDVRKLIKESDFCIIMLSLDDKGCRESDFESKKEKALKKRIRQNVILELGMAINQFSADKYLLLSNYPENAQYEPPSDIDGFKPNPYNPKQIQGKIDSLGEFLVQKLALTPHCHLLSQKEIALPYKKELFEELNTSIYEGSDDDLAEKIFKEWVDTVQTFDFPSERIVFVLERIKFLTCFGRDETLNVKPLLALANDFSTTSPKGDDEDPLLVQFGLDLTATCLAYTAHRMGVETQDQKDGYERARDSLRGLYDRYQSLKGRFTFSPLLEIVLFDFYGLAEGTMAVKFKDGDPFKALALYQEAQKVLPKIDDGSKTWNGYVDLDLARQAERCLREGKSEDKDLMSLMNDNFKTAIAEREAWKDILTYPIFFRQAIAFEYFRAKRYQLKAIVDHEHLSVKEAKARGQELLQEINDYAIKQMKRIKGERDSLEDYLVDPKNPKSFYN